MGEPSSGTENDKGYTQYQHRILDAQVRKVVTTLSPAHAVALLNIHRITGGKRQTTFEMTGGGLGATMGISPGRARNLIVELKGLKAIKVTGRKPHPTHHLPNRVGLTKPWSVPIPFQYENLKGYYPVPNVLPDELQREIIASKEGSPRVYLVLFYLVAQQDDNGLTIARRDELAKRTGLTERSLKEAIRVLSTWGYIECEGFGHHGAEYRLCETLQKDCKVTASVHARGERVGHIQSYFGQKQSEGRTKRKRGVGQRESEGSDKEKATT